jgi:sulfur-carrier protein adenylyltransferase/sulfurtransferase
MAELDFQISAPELNARLESGDELVLIDVREQFEWDICRLPGARLIPMNELPARLAELDDEREMIVYCHAGVRSARVVSWLRTQGFEKARNLAGGIDAWSCSVDPRVPRY